MLQWLSLAVLIPIAAWLVYDRVSLYTSSIVHDANVVSCQGKLFDINRELLFSHSKVRQQFQYAPVAISENGVKGTGQYWLSQTLCKRTIGNKVKILISEKSDTAGSIYSFTHFWFFPLLAIVFILLFIVFEKSKLFNRLLLLAFVSGSAYFFAKEYNFLPTSDSAYENPLARCINASMLKEAVDTPEALKRLDCSKENIDDLAALSHLQSLEQLQLQNNLLTSLKSMPPLTSLKEIHLSGMKSLVSLEGISQLPKLETLVANKSAIKDISELGKLAHLKKLQLMMNNVRDISPLASLRNLTRINLNYNPISSIDGLADKPQLIRLGLHKTNVKSILPLYSSIRLMNLGVSGAEGASCEEFTVLKKILSINAKIYKHKYCD